MDQRIIILEGTDMCGKTEISIELSKRLFIPRFKASNEHKDFLSEKNNFLIDLQHSDFRVVDLLKQTQQSIIFDRAYPSEFVYSHVLGRVTDLDALKRIDEAYAALGTKIVICHRSSYEGIVDDIDPVRLNSHKLQCLDERYVTFSTWTKCECLRLNVDDENLDREIEDIRTFFRIH
jgi:hypothetical protein